MRVTLTGRDFLAPLVQPDVEWLINSLRWNIRGGCEIASLTAYGGATELWELIEMLRGGVVITGDVADPLWWGYISEVRVRVGAIEVGATIDSMANAVQVAYSYVPAGSSTVGTRKTTAWATDDDSIAEYGRKELVASTGGLTDAGATARRDALLASRKYPMGTVNPFGAGQGGVMGHEHSATINCKGWMETLAWRYAAVVGTASTVTTTQIGDLVTSYGAFLLGTGVDAASGISTSQYRKGDKTALAEILELMDIGGAGGRRLLASVDNSRYLVINEEPASTVVPYRLKADGRLTTDMDAPIYDFGGAVGKWCRLDGVVPDSADITKLINPSLQFIEGLTWSEIGGLSPQFKGQASVNDIVKVRL